MSAPEFIQSEGEKFRDFSESDVHGSHSSLSSRGNQFVQESFTDREINIPQAIRESAREATLADQIRESFEDEGLVVIDRRNGEILAIEEDSRELRQALSETPVPAEHRLIVRCYE